MAEPLQGVNQERPKKRGHYMTYLSNSGDLSTCKIPKSTRRRWEKLKEQRQTSKNFEPTSRIDGKVKEELLDPAADNDLDLHRQPGIGQPADYDVEEAGYDIFEYHAPCIDQNSNCTLPNINENLHSESADSESKAKLDLGLDQDLESEKKTKIFMLM